MPNIPDWLNTNENYSAVKDSTSFVDKSISSFKGTLFKLRKKGSGVLKENAITYFSFIVLTILLMSLSRNMLFTYVVLTLFVFRIALLNSDDIREILKTSLRAFVFSCFILFPSVFMGYPKTMLTISIKVFISAGLLSLYSLSYDTNELIACFRKIGIPDLVIYIFDTTIKYIIAFSKSANELLQSLKCRLIGKLKKKDKSVSNIMGITYIKSVRMSKDMLDAMECRGFVGEYKIRTHNKYGVYDLLRILIMITELILFIYLGA